MYQTTFIEPRRKEIVWESKASLCLMKWEKVQRILRKKNHTCTEKKDEKNICKFYFFYMAEIKKHKK